MFLVPLDPSLSLSGERNSMVASSDMYGWAARVRWFKYFEQFVRGGSSLRACL